uniref:PDZ domain-containing protein n=1 Tax=Noctiluca scintillans TaxID=2966 RepID=A0A7S1AH01_NOCSC|mmetsp:Transcript_45920/g.121768  ORF Transcript_45920/g.121768 Transcript_45920/m.121768 type:complete len:169 (+) Transcript_45920:68-574(+)
MELMRRLGYSCCCHESMAGGHLLLDADQADPFRSAEKVEPRAPSVANQQPAIANSVRDNEKAERIAMPAVVNADETVAVGEEYTVTVTKDVGNVFGVKVLQSQKSCAISVKSVNPGLIMAWNETHPEQRVKVGDKLVSVNGVRGPTSLSIMQRLMQDRTLDLVFLSCS